jgi:hypothetical protein
MKVSKMAQPNTRAELAWIVRTWLDDEVAAFADCRKYS